MSSPIFPKGIDQLKPIGIAIKTMTAIAVLAVIYFYFGDSNLSVGYQPVQPIPFDHAKHSSQLGIDCRYCHTGVEKGAVSGIPPAETCFGCHSKIKTNSALLKPLVDRMDPASPDFGKPIEWVRVHKLPQYAYFDHSVHVKAGLSCVSCHGRVDQMTSLRQEKSLSMKWCIDCHQGGWQDHVRPPSVNPTDLGWTWPTPAAKEDFIKTLKSQGKYNPPQDCGACHR